MVKTKHKNNYKQTKTCRKLYLLYTRFMSEIYGVCQKYMENAMHKCQNKLFREYEKEGVIIFFILHLRLWLTYFHVAEYVVTLSIVTNNVIYSYKNLLFIEDCRKEDG